MGILESGLGRVNFGALRDNAGYCAYFSDALFVDIRGRAPLRSARPYGHSIHFIPFTALPIRRRESGCVAGEFEGRLALVTGGAGEIGRAAARKFLAAGARVTLADLDEKELESARDEFGGAGGRVETRVLDVADSGAVTEVIGDVHARHGKIDILVNCAGIYRHQAVLEMTDDEWDRTLGVNLRGTFAACRAAAGFMMKQESGGVIVNLTSLAGQRGSPLHAHYCASKAGVIGFGRALALELAPKVRVNAVAPGIIETKMTADMIPVRGAGWKRQIPAGRFGTADEVADAVYFLASDKATYINGAVLNVNGGMWMD